MHTPLLAGDDPTCWMLAPMRCRLCLGHLLAMAEMKVRMPLPALSHSLPLLGGSNRGQCACHAGSSGAATADAAAASVMRLDELTRWGKPRCVLLQLHCAAGAAGVRLPPPPCGAAGAG